jgi:tetratricopeptide (TPR) repeat protein
MKKVLIACFFLLGHIALQAATTGPQQQQFAKANDLFRQKQYTEAAGMFQQLIDQGYEQPELYMNAGNAWYKANRTGLAIYDYEKALEQDPFNTSATHNLAVANQRVDGYMSDLPPLFFQQWWTGLMHFFTPNGWAAGAIIFFWLMIAAVITVLVKPGILPRLMRWGAGVTAVLFIFFLTVGISAYAETDMQDSGIVMSASVKAKAAPDQNSKDIFELHEGMKVQVTDATQEYCKILLPDGKTGWLACGEIKRL